MFSEIFKAGAFGIDLHGVLDFAPDLFKPLLNLFMCANRRVYIVSGPPKEDIKKELATIDVEPDRHYTQILSVVDYLKYTGVKMWQDDKERWWSDGKDWWESKGKICKKFNIDVMLDDHIEFKDGFPDGHRTKFVLFNYYWKEYLELIKGG